MAVIPPHPASVRIAEQLALLTAMGVAQLLTPDEAAMVVALPPNGGLLGYEALPEAAGAYFRTMAASGFHLTILQHLMVVMPFGLNPLGRRVREVLAGVVDIPLLDLTRGGPE